MTEPKRNSALAGAHAWLDSRALQQIGAQPTHAQNDPDPGQSQNTTLCAIRSRRFMAQGMSQQQADALAARLLARDKGWDDRRSCAECSHFEHGNCMARREPFGGGGVNVLHRCAAFEEAQQ